MTDQLTALRELAAKVEAGVTSLGLSDCRDAILLRANVPFVHGAVNVCAAYAGDLNAAKALHEAQLPGWGVSLWGGYTNDPIAHKRYGINLSKVCPDKRLYAKAANDDPARAWLIAILKAKIVELDEA